MGVPQGQLIMTFQRPRTAQFVDANPSVFRLHPPADDPTGTGVIRNRFRHAAASRVVGFKRMMRKYIIEHNLLGLGTQYHFNAAGVSQDGAYSGFVDYVTTLIYDKLVGQGTWTQSFLEDAYTSGLVQAWAMTLTPTTNELRIDPMLVTSTRHQIEGIADATLQQMSRVVLDGLQRRDKPHSIMRAVLEVLNRVTLIRLAALVNVVVVQAHNSARLDWFEAIGRTHVSVVPERVRDSRPRMRYKPVGMRDAKKDFDPDPDLEAIGVEVQEEGITYRAKIKAPTNLPEAKTFTKLPDWLAKRMPPSLAKKLNKELAATAGATESEYRKATRANNKWERSGIKMVEVVTAGDMRVCDKCDEIAEFGPYTINRARSLIPAHPNCRCAFVDVKVYKEDEDDDD